MRRRPWGLDAPYQLPTVVAEILSHMRDEIHGTIKFIFQPAEEGPPLGEEGGAPLMIKEGALENPRPSAIFGLHVSASLPSGRIGYRPGAAMASADTCVSRLLGGKAMLVTLGARSIRLRRLRRSCSDCRRW